MKSNFRNGDIATEPLLDLLLEDIGISGPAREGTRKYLADIIKQNKKDQIFTIGHCKKKARGYYADYCKGFYAGYIDAIK